MDAILVRPLVDLQLLLIWYTAEDDDLNKVKEIKAENGNIAYVKALNKVNRNIIAFLSTKIVDRNVSIQFCQPWQHSCSPRFSDIFSSQEELFELNPGG